MYTWRHNKVLEVIIVKSTMWDSKPATVTANEPIIQFHQEGKCYVRKQKNSDMKILKEASDKEASVDLKASLKFPIHIIQAEKRPDIVARSDSKKSVLLIE